MFLGGVVMAAVPVLLGIAFGIFLYKQLKKERAHDGGAHERSGTP